MQHTEEITAALAPDQQRTESTASFFLLLLVVADAAFIFLHFMAGTTPTLDSPLFSLERDRGYAEFYQYVKELWIVVGLLALSGKTRTLGFIAWSALFGYLLIDDALQVHERVGGVLSEHLEFIPLFALRAQDFGELLVTAIAGGCLFTLLAGFYLYGSSNFRRSTRHLMLLLSVVVFFGVVVDMLHVVFHTEWVVGALGVLEDGGEMFAMSFIVWYVFLLHICNGDLALSLRALLNSALTGLYGDAYRGAAPDRDEVDDLAPAQARVV